MTDTPDEIQRQIDQLEAMRPSLGDAAVDEAIAALRAQPQPTGETHGTATVGGNNTGQNVGVNTGIMIFNQYGQPAPELLDHLVHALRAYHQRLRERQANQRPPTSERPYKFLDYFDLEDVNVFHGRATETEQVYQLQQRSRLAVLHAPSGAGKTSLLQAGLMQRLLKETCLPVYVRTGASPLHTFYQQILPPADWATALMNKPLVDVLSALDAALQQAGLQRIVLIFDQFEELFVGTTREARARLAQDLKDVLTRELAVSLLISIRDDYLSRLGGEFNRVMPSILNNQQRLDAMNPSGAVQAMTLPLLTLPQPREFASDLLSVLLADLTVEYDSGVTLPHLQIVCTELYRRQPPNERTITREAYDQAGRAAGILGGYLNERLRWLGDQQELARAVLKELVSSEATRRQVRETRLQQRYADQADHLAEVLTTFVEQRILRRLDDEEGSAYEVAHEYLIEEVRQWLDEDDFEVKRAQDMLAQEVANYRAYGTLIPPDRLKILQDHWQQLQFDDPDTVACILASGILYEVDTTQWVNPSIARNPLIHLLNPDTDREVRIKIARILGDLGDPRYPVTLDEWRAEITRRNETFGAPDGYWCYVRPGTYQIGGWIEGKEGVDHKLPGFWIARYPVTVAQYAAFIDDRGYQNEDYWTPEGWEWIQLRNRTQPWGWDDARYSRPNQAVMSVTWYESMAFCGWLTTRLAATGYEVRLPTEAEWEAAAAYDGQMQRRSYPWGEEEPTPEHAIFADDHGNRMGAPAPVGVCPAGAAACGALDMGGQVWEWCRSNYAAYPQEANKGVQEFKRDAQDAYGVPLRGGSWYNGRTHVRCAARYWDLPGNWFDLNIGFRVLLSPRVLPDSR
jgi:formylglycine-generating enzyme required for sulfatase activity